ncbi:lipid II flippase MurJ [Streptomyces marispadix]|uniref:Virulence factor MviN n=1 Tax=Streptomyces marispadix TaxID=2922868 RepID=A0ABS9T067_9ACTN|nr:lipid II flippase MurJ [Streptomyces marispadix]MCH6161926.1 virulence factor MviN [Streptomyces marispadix]
MTDTHASRSTTRDALPPPAQATGEVRGGEGASPPLLGRFLARAAVITAALTAAGAFFGLLRDQTIASLFGADADTDAFLVAWTVPELAATLLIEDAMALILVPAFSLALARRAAGPSPTENGAVGTDGRAADGVDARPFDPVRDVVRRTLPRLLLGLTCIAALMLLAAPLLVRVLAPGLPDSGTAVDCMRLTSLTVVTFGVAGYFSAALRAHRRFVAPAAIYVAYNAAIIAVMFAGHTLWGVRAAAVGVAVGGGLMVVVQLPSFIRQLPSRTRRAPAAGAKVHANVTSKVPAKVSVSAPAEAAAETAVETAPSPAPAAPTTPTTASTSAVPPAHSPSGTTAELPAPADASGLAPSQGPGAAAAPGPHSGRIALLGMGVLAPVVTFAVSRQAQVLFERYLASPLPAGAISHLNYAQKVAQMPMVLSLMVCTVTFPVVARAMADGDRERARLRVERDLALVGIVVLLGAAYVTACAPQLIQLLFQRGEFDAGDTADTASVMRVYCCGLLGHSLVGALVRPFFSGNRPPWYPAAAMGVGLLVTVAAGAVAVRPWGVHGIAAANAAGILTTALLLLHGLGARVVAIDVRRVAAGLARLLLAAVVAAAAGWGAARLVAHPLTGAMAGGVAVLVVFASVAHLVRAPEMPQLVATVKRRFAHVR